jgi:hypothetical protein
MGKKENKKTQYFIDLDLGTHKVLNLDFGQKDKLAAQELTNPFH